MNPNESTDHIWGSYSNFETPLTPLTPAYGIIWNHMESDGIRWNHMEWNPRKGSAVSLSRLARHTPAILLLTLHRRVTQARFAGWVVLGATKFDLQYACKGECEGGRARVGKGGQRQARAGKGDTTARLCSPIKIRTLGFSIGLSCLAISPYRSPA